MAPWATDKCRREGLCPDGQMTSGNLLLKLSKKLRNNWEEVFYSYFLFRIGKLELQKMPISLSKQVT